MRHTDRLPSHEVLDHTSELLLRVRAPTFATLLEEAGRALGAVLARGVPGRPLGGWRSVAVESPDRAALLVDWLNELIFRAEAERWVPVEFALDAVSDTRLRGRVRGANVEEAPALVKAATFHGLEVRDADGTVEAEVILDV